MLLVVVFEAATRVAGFAHALTQGSQSHEHEVLMQQPFQLLFVRMEQVCDATLLLVSVRLLEWQSCHHASLVLVCTTRLSVETSFSHKGVSHNCLSVVLATWHLSVVLVAVSCVREGIPLEFHQSSLILRMLPERSLAQSGAFHT